MSGPRVVDWSGTDEALEKRLADFAAATWSRVRKDPRGGWLLSFGSALSANPNDLAFRLRVAREGDGLSLRPSAIVAPWSRAKAARIVAHREAQLTAFLAGKPSEPERLREPFASWGATPASISAAFAWVAASGAAGLLAAALATALATLPLLGVTVAELKTHAALLAAAGEIPLPAAAELDRAGLAFRLGAAFVGGVPFAFFAGLLHVLALAASDASLRCSRFPQATFAFLALLLFFGLFPYTPWLALPCALAVPAAIHAAYVLVGSRRREPMRIQPRPRRAAVVVGVVFALAALGFMAPVPAFGEDMSFRVSLFRDRALLGHPTGKALARAYYATTLYSAWPLKEFFAAGGGRPTRSQRTATASTPELAASLRALGFTIVPAGSPADVDVTPEAASARGERAELRGELKRALDVVSRDSFRGGLLRQMNDLGWMSVYFAGPPALVLAVIGLCCPFVSIMYRAMSAKGATIALAVCGLTTLLLMVAGNAAIGGLKDELANMRRHPTSDNLRRGLAHGSVVFRHEAAVLAHQHPHPSLGDALLKAADDPDLRVRLWACGALGKTGHEKALAKLVDRLEDVELFVRYRAAEGLGHLRRAEAVEPLRRMLRERSWYEGVYALEALRRIEAAR